MNRTSRLLILIAAMNLALAACNEKNPMVAANSQTAVKVNGQAVSAAELETRAGGSADAHKRPISEETIKHAVDMELLRQAAVQAKLDMDENLRARIAVANRLILATAYMEKQLDAVAKPTETEINAFYNQNPALFAERKHYQFREFSIQPPPGKAAEIQAQLGKIKNYTEFDSWLTGKNIPHGSTLVSVTGDRLPEDVLQKLKNVTVGGAAVLGGENQMNVVFVLDEVKQPLTLAQAGPMISNMLMDKRKREALDKMGKQVREKAKIEYVAPFTEKGFTPPMGNQ